MKSEFCKYLLRNQEEKEKVNMKVKVNVGEKNYAMSCNNGQLRPGKGKTEKQKKKLGRSKNAGRLNSTGYILKL